MEPILTGTANAMMTYYLRKPYTVPKAGLLRWLESTDKTFLCAEIDDKSYASPRDTKSRYNVQ